VAINILDRNAHLLIHDNHNNNQHTLPYHLHIYLGVDYESDLDAEEGLVLGCSMPIPCQRARRSKLCQNSMVSIPKTRLFASNLLEDFS
jgi:hypothetical protein